jgi:hypothetical protein
MLLVETTGPEATLWSTRPAAVRADVSGAGFCDCARHHWGGITLRPGATLADHGETVDATSGSFRRFWASGVRLAHASRDIPVPAARSRKRSAADLPPARTRASDPDFAASCRELAVSHFVQFLGGVWEPRVVEPAETPPATAHHGGTFLCL